jgi:predicted 2-oxoglutarate/Fe(II)-dependent dioxygenase YbiX
MPSLDFFERLGIFVNPNFLEASVSTEYLSQARTSTGITALIRRGQAGNVLIDDTSRKTTQLQMSESVLQSVKTRFLELKPQLEAFFNLKLAALEAPLFYRYQVGDFFGPHRDVPQDGAQPHYYEQNRRVSLISFLNASSDTLDLNSFGGGLLTFYGLMQRSGWENYGFSLTPEPGLLIAFRSHLLHEVKPVTRGERFTIVSWFTGDGGA